MKTCQWEKIKNSTIFIKYENLHALECFKSYTKQSGRCIGDLSLRRPKITQIFLKASIWKVWSGLQVIANNRGLVKGFVIGEDIKLSKSLTKIKYLEPVGWHTIITDNQGVGEGIVIGKDLKLYKSI